METYVGKGNSPYINEGKGVILAQKSHKSPPPQSLRQKALVEICMVTGITGLQNLALRNVIVFNCTPSGNEFVDMLYSTGMKFLSKLTNILLVKVRSACCRCAASDSVQTSCLHSTLSQSSAHAAGLHSIDEAALCKNLCWSSVWSRACCAPRGVSRRNKKMKKKKKNWLAKEGKREHTAGTSTAPAPCPKITYLPNLQNALRGT
eukprot:1136276-Pelagomonas_calceolata.AAC.5